MQILLNLTIQTLFPYKNICPICLSQFYAPFLIADHGTQMTIHTFLYREITITLFSSVFLFRPKSWSILNCLFSRFKLCFLTIGKTRCAACFEKHSFWLTESINAVKVINLNSRRIEYLRTKVDGVPNTPRKFWRLVALRCAENCLEVTLHRSEGWLRAIWSPTSEQQCSGSER